MFTRNKTPSVPEEIVYVSFSNITREVYYSYGHEKFYRSCRILSTSPTDTKVCNPFFKHINHNHWWLDLQRFLKMSLLTNLLMQDWPLLWFFILCAHYTRCNYWCKKFSIDIGFFFLFLFVQQRIYCKAFYVHYINAIINHEIWFLLNNFTLTIIFVLYLLIIRCYSHKCIYLFFNGSCPYRRSF